MSNSAGIFSSFLAEPCRTCGHPRGVHSAVGLGCNHATCMCDGMSSLNVAIEPSHAEHVRSARVAEIRESLKVMAESYEQMDRLLDAEPETGAPYDMRTKALVESARSHGLLLGALLDLIEGT